MKNSLETSKFKIPEKSTRRVSLMEFGRQEEGYQEEEGEGGQG